MGLLYASQTAHPSAPLSAQNIAALPPANKLENRVKHHFGIIFKKLQIIKRGDPNVLVNITGHKLRTKGIYLFLILMLRKLLSMKIIFQPQCSRPMNVLVGTVYKKRCLEIHN